MLNSLINSSWEFCKHSICTSILLHIRGKAVIMPKRIVVFRNHSVLSSYVWNIYCKLR